MMNPKVSVVVAVDVFHPVASFAEGLARQIEPFENFELIVADAVDRAEIRHAIERAAAATEGRLKITRVYNSVGSRAALQNAGIAAARANILIFLTNDAVLEPQGVRSHLDFHEQHPEETAVAVGTFLSPQNQRKGSAFLRWLEDSGTLLGVSFTTPPVVVPEDFFSCFNSSIKRSFLLHVGGFDERFPYSTTDDFELGRRLRRAGMRSHHIPEAVAIHDHPVGFGERCGALYRSGRSARYILKAPSAQTAPARSDAASVARRHSRGEAGLLRDSAWRAALRASYLAGRLRALFDTPGTERGSR
jgi:GT2 family glycosyltransferase